MERKKLDLKKSFETTLQIVQKNPFWFIVTGSALILVLVLWGVFAFVGRANEESASRTLYYSQGMLQSAYYTITNQAERQQVEQQQVDQIITLVQTHPRTVAATRARLFLANRYVQQASYSRQPEGYDTAIVYYNGIIANSGSKFYKAEALIGRAQVYEKKGELDNAVADYNRVLKSYPKEGFNPYAMIGIARCYEVTQDAAKNRQAYAYYERVQNEYPDSYWAKYARAKIYVASSLSQAKAAAPAPSALPALPKP